ncbi:MAG: hypothetical protein PHS44_05180 [Candidatus Dojkabacteria bacterium]|nr:hypothetical protein [Candidatus Dojkabacteria bacterium]
MPEDGQKHESERSAQGRLLLEITPDLDIYQVPFMPPEVLFRAFDEGLLVNNLRIIDRAVRVLEKLAEKGVLDVQEVHAVCSLIKGAFGRYHIRDGPRIIRELQGLEPAIHTFGTKLGINPVDGQGIHLSPMGSELEKYLAERMNMMSGNIVSASESHRTFFPSLLAAISLTSVPVDQIGILYLDQHADMGSKPFDGARILSVTKAEVAKATLGIGIGALGYVGLSLHQYDHIQFHKSQNAGNSATQRVIAADPRDYLVGQKQINKGILMNSVRMMLGKMKALEVRYFITSLDLDVLNASKFSAPMYSLAGALLALGVRDYAKTIVAFDQSYSLVGEIKMLEQIMQDQDRDRLGDSAYFRLSAKGLLRSLTNILQDQQYLSEELFRQIDSAIRESVTEGSSVEVNESTLRSLARSIPCPIPITYGLYPAHVVACLEAAYTVAPELDIQPGLPVGNAVWHGGIYEYELPDIGGRTAEAFGEIFLGWQRALRYP